MRKKEMNLRLAQVLSIAIILLFKVDYFVLVNLVWHIRIRVK